MEKLAIFGGEPVRETLLPYGRQWIDEKDIEAVSRMLSGDFLTTGPNIDVFEKKLAEKVGADFAVALSSGTAALHAAVFAAGIGAGDEAITTPLTFAASANCVLFQCGRPQFADVKRDTLNIDPDEIRKKITDRTKALIPVDLAGRPAELDEINEIAKDCGLHVIEDGTHAIGATYKGRTVGSISEMTAFSFHPVKHIAMGEGGAVTTDNEELYEKLRLFRSHGITRDKKLLKENHGPWYYEQIQLGYNYRITDIQCALGISQLDRLDEFVRIRRDHVKQYNDAFSKMDGLTTPEMEKHNEPSWHLYMIQLELEKLKAGRREIFEALLAENIGVNVHYIPVYYFPYYRSLGYEKGLCPNAEFIYERIISLPLFPRMTHEDLKDVIYAVEKVIGYYLK